jgi:hypothetical protein
VSRTRRRTLSQAVSSRHDESEGTTTHVSQSIVSESAASTRENDDDANDAPRPDFPVQVEAILSRADITSFRLSWGEQERANSTPKLSLSTFARIFGGLLVRDWVKRRQGDYKQFLYSKSTAQPFGPTSIGGRGLALLGPAWIDAQGDEGGFTIFHVFVTVGEAEGPMEYMGDYTIVPLQQPAHIDWSLLSQTVRSSCFYLRGI